MPSDFKVNSLEGRQASEFIRGRFLGRYGAPLAPGYTTSARVAPTAEASAHAARESVQARVCGAMTYVLTLATVTLSQDIPQSYPPFGKALKPSRQDPIQDGEGPQPQNIPTTAP